jgi:hypothetical protein
LEDIDDTSARESIYYDIETVTSNAIWLESIEGLGGINSYVILDPDKIILHVSIKIPATENPKKSDVEILDYTLKIEIYRNNTEIEIFIILLLNLREKP